MKMKGFSIIVACDEQGGVGKGGALPWHIPADLRHFKEVTTALPGAAPNVVIMGRKTWESIPEKFRPLPLRLNVVITSSDDYRLPAGVVRVDSLEDGLKIFCDAARDDVGAVFVIGGARVYAEAIHHPLCESIYLTRLYEKSHCDVFFPEIPAKFVIKTESPKKEENEKMFSFFFLSSK